MSVRMVESGTKMESSIDFAPLVKSLKKHGWKVVLATVLVTGACVPLVMSISSKYVSTAAVLIKAQEDNATPIQQVDGYDSTRGRYYDTQYNLMQSRVILERAIKTLKLDEDARYNGDKPLSESHPEWTLSEQERMEKALKMLRQNITFTEVRQTQLVYVSFESKDPQEAARVANGVSQAFIDYTVDKKVEKTEAAQRWNEEQMKDLRQQIAAKKQEMEQFLDKEGLLTFRGIDGYETEELGIVTNKLADAKERRLASQAQYEIVARNLNAPIEDIASMPEVSAHPQMQDLRIALIQAKRNLADLELRYGPKHNKVLEAKAQIHAIEAQTRSLLQELKEGLLKQYQTDLAKENRYKALAKVQKDDFKTLVAKRDHYESLKTDLDKTEDLYRQLFLRSKEQSLTSQYREADAVLYDPAAAAERPQKPNKALLLAMVAILTPALCILYLIIRAALDRKIYMLSQIQSKLGLKPLADIPRFEGEEPREQLVSLIESNPYAMETILGLKTAVRLAAPQARVVGVMATTVQEGASLLAQLLAKAWSQNERTLLVDLDYRGSGALSFSVIDHPQPEPNGVAQWIETEQSLDTLIQPLATQCDFLPRGVWLHSPLVLFANERYAELMHVLKERYDCVIVNLPALSDSKDSQLAAQALDTVLVVVRAEQRQAPEMVNDLRKLHGDNIHVVGGVLNQVNAENLQSEESKRFITQGSFTTFAAVE
ncbi:GumC family protein [Vibrio fluvialis]|uniref:GumC family protein n=1 Tax=Vibrio fluvialis TaxID=676 RepID=UPI0013022F02|nr:polysaccharide biosynthesis tyrosine autokinase [Vibrio fluvialis]ELS8948305.1 polysaccharide biosynthesis tyrosine autokinase [Vibrio fluvialis]MBY8203008.1 polysaccharide biosynthesis tyrosine autokinase [Vibrio fluvialis]MBY8207502.1 polysaccharide biosynthesis tyrosine autokinase [Vibrio fluvialis]MCG6385491.1 polysaccharide biosynthesis tyrosine autokinase [Vibrio fluvialis]